MADDGGFTRIGGLPKPPDDGGFKRVDGGFKRVDGGFKRVAPPTQTAQPAASPGVFDPRSVKAALAGSVTPEQRKLVGALATYPAHAAEGLLNIPKEAFEASEEYRRGGEYNAAPIVDAALLGVAPSVAGRRPIPTAAEAPKPTLSAEELLKQVHPNVGETSVEINGQKATSSAAQPAPPVKPGFVRFYHGASSYADPTGYAAWLTPHEAYARNYRGGPNEVHYVDIPLDEAKAQGGIDEINGDRPRNFQADQATSQKLRPLQPAPKAPEPPKAAPEAPKPAAPAAFPDTASEAPKASGPPGGGPPPEAPNPFDQFKPSKTSALLKPAREVGTLLNKIFNPEKIGKGESAETLSRSKLGTAARDTETTKAAFDEYHKAVNALPDNDKIALIGYMEGRTKGATIKDPALQPVADAIKTAAELRKTKLQATPSTQQMAFVEDYYRHQWENPQQAQAFTNDWIAKQGSGKNLKKRSIPTIADGMAAGLKPKTLNPLENMLDYITNMDRFIAHNAIIDAGRAAKDVKYYRNPKIPAKLGLVKLEGRLATKRGPAGDMQAYADKDWARVYNNSIAKGWHQWETAGQIYDKLQTASNSITGLELSLSGFHLFTMAHESLVSDVALAVGEAGGAAQALRAGEVAEAAKLLAGSAWNALRQPTAFARKPYLGHKAQQVYLGRSAGSTMMRKTMDLLEAGGGRAIGRAHAADYKFTAANSYFTAIKRGELAASVRQDFSKGMLRGFARQFGRTMQSFSQPLFELYIPKMKVGAFHDNMAAWLEANPAASYPDQVRMAKRIWDSIDNRFGEVVQDNIFWNTMLKQTAQLGMRSYSWNLGTVREIGGGAKNLLTKPRSLGIRGNAYDPKTGYVVALPITVAIVNGIYQYAMTGKMPESVDDLVAPRTGGMVPGIAGKNAAKGRGGNDPVEERAQLPGYQKDVFGWYDDWRQEAGNKMSTLLSTGKELLENKDWQGDMISPPETSAPEWMKNYFMFVIGKGLPISVKQGIQGEKKGSKLGLQSYLGIRPSPAQFTDPKGLAGVKQNQTKQWENKRKWQEKNQERVYGGPDE